MDINPKLLMQMQNAIEKIEAVHSSKLIKNDENEIVECHILATSKRHPKQISKDVQSVLAAKFEYRIDHRIISVAQIESDSQGKLAERIIYKSVEVKRVEHILSAIVTCQYKDIQYEGRYSGVSTRNSDFRIVAEATLEAIRCHIKKDEHIVLEGSNVNDIGGIVVATVVLTLVCGKKEYPLVGTSIVGDHLHESYVKAVFNALNRILFTE